MTKLALDAEGFGSYASILEYVEKVLRDNWIPREDNTRMEPYSASARAITQSVCNRLGIQWHD